MLDNAANVVERSIRQARVAISCEGVVTALGDGLVNVHTRAVITHQRLRHKGGRLAISVRNVQDTVLQNLYFIRLGNQGVELDANLTLARRADFVVVHFHVQTHLLHGRAHGGADVMQRIDWRHGEVATFNAGAMPDVAVFEVHARGPCSFLSVNGVACAAHIGVPLHVIKNEKLWLGTKKRSVTQTGRGQVSFGFLGNAARVSVVALHGGGLDNIATQNERWVVSERVQQGSAVIGHQNHVGLVDTFPTRNRRAVEHLATLKEIFIHRAGGD